MPAIPPIPAELLAAYRDADYVVEHPAGAFTLRIGQASASLQALMDDARASTAAFVTAHNPRSEPASDAGNASAQAALETDLRARELRWLPGEGRDRSGHWRAERSALVLGVSLRQASGLARRYGQHAFVWVGAPDGVCTLRLVPSRRGSSRPADPANR
jgi:hypothetical protein